MVSLRGMTWNHPRGTEPLRAASELFAARHPGVEVSWQARSLAAFEETPVTELAREFDLLAIDHPFVGTAYADGAFLRLDDHLPPDVLADQGAGSVGPSHVGYRWAGGQWALAMDAAAQVAAYRPGLVGTASLPVPRSWDDVVALAGDLPGGASLGIAANPTHLYSTLVSLCHDRADDRAPHLDGRPAWWGDDGPARDVLAAGCARLYEVLGLVDPRSLALDPIALLDEMSEPWPGRGVCYVPYVFGYVTYARPGARPALVAFADAPSSAGSPVGTILGGVGLAVSRGTAHPELAVEFARLVVSPEFQRDGYAAAGGQPGHRVAWSDPAVNAAASGFYTGTLATLDAAAMRPRVPGYPAYQRRAAEALHAAVLARESAAAIADELRDLWRTMMPAPFGGDLP
ncbi:MAG: extracellular solute-binding protein [Streptosporangiales bacterium]|nr:extracellular solute-binding protein [Streptosporangiales bacterium]